MEDASNSVREFNGKEYLVRMHEDDPQDVTLLLNAVSEGQESAREELLGLVYEGLRKIAQKRMANERQDHTLQATALVHEAYLKMAGQLEAHSWDNRAHFYGAAAEAMRRILIDHARKKGTAKRGGQRLKIGLNVLDLAETEDNSEAILALGEAFQRLEEKDAQLAQVVRLRFFAGLSVEDTAQALNLSKRTVIRNWTFARTWLFRELDADPNRRDDSSPSD